MCDPGQRGVAVRPGISLLPRQRFLLYFLLSLDLDDYPNGTPAHRPKAEGHLSGKSIQLS